MKQKTIIKKICTNALMAGALLVFAACNSAEKKKAIDYVDPTIGGVGVLLQPTRPTVHLPNQMLRMYPMKKDQLDDRISYFPLTNASHRMLWLFGFMPVEGAAKDHEWGSPVVYDQEVTTPYYYAATLGEHRSKIEFTPEKKSGIFRITFGENEPHYLQLNTLNGKGEIKITSNREIIGTEEFNGMKAYLYATFDADMGQVRYDNDNMGKALIDLGQSATTITMRYAISYISNEQARLNLENEIPNYDFDKVKQYAKTVWEDALSLISVEGGTEAQKRVFYTALYRCYERMVDINEYGCYYSNYDRHVHESDKPFYVDNWLWDMYIAHEPLHTILNPQFVTDQINSYIDMYRQGGTMPSFALVTGDHPAMTGNFAAAWFADAWFKGLKDFDLKTAYEGLKKNSLDATLIPWRNGPKTLIDDFYNEYGYMPGLHPGEKEIVPEVDTRWEQRQSVAVTTVNSYSDWCIAQLATDAGNIADRELFLQRATNYKNVFRTDKNFMWPKDKDGNWIEPFDPRFADRMYFTENNAYTFDWDVKHDLQGLFGLMGGRAKAEKKLDQLFREDLGLPKYRFWGILPDATGLVGQFSMGNEPSFHIPYIYDYLGSPWKTQKRVRMLLDAFFTDNLFGIPGDEDGGGMSAFVVFSMMGFFPVTPGIPVYAIGSPIFDKTTIKLSDGKMFTIIAKNNSTENKYIQSATLNGKPLTKPWFTHAELVSGGVLEFIMDNRPNKQWGAGENDAPPSELGYVNSK